LVIVFTLVIEFEFINIEIPELRFTTSGMTKKSPDDSQGFLIIYKFSNQLPHPTHSKSELDSPTMSLAGMKVS